MAISVRTKPELNKIIGNGPKYPMEFSENRKTELLELQTGLDKIHQSIRIIISTRRGERYNNPEFGCDVKSYVFEPNDILLRSLLYYTISDALQRWEKRISVTSITFQGTDEDSSIHPNQINIIINYKVNSTHQVGSYVYPFVVGGMPYGELVIGKNASNLGINNLLGSSTFNNN